MPDDPTTSPLWPADSPAVTAHINLLQGIINRLANNSASCKTWCLTLVAALVSLAGATRVAGIVTFTLVPILIFGFLDTMYLAQEKAYRRLFTGTVETIRRRAYGVGNVYDARATRRLEDVFDAISSWSVWPVYGGLIAAYLLARYTGWFAVLTATPKQP